MTHDELLEKYSRHLEILNSHRECIEHGIVPHANVPGAPQDLGTASSVVESMIFVATSIVNDLLAMKMEFVFDEAMKDEVSSLMDSE